MEQLAYSSMAALLAHYRTLSNAATDRDRLDPLTKREAEILAAMRHMMEALTPNERAALLADAAARNENPVSGEERRRGQRAQFKLRRILLNKGVVRD
ncbi:MAG: hypothetical protein JO166_01490 [Deltaproteobacteria bacterium]|nr:hypothetical protein [Deltaproteobacteria bacterium]